MDAERESGLTNYGVDFSVHGYTPEICSHTGEVLAVLEDESHKLKNKAQSWHGQVERPELRGFGRGKPPDEQPYEPMTKAAAGRKLGELSPTLYDELQAEAAGLLISKNSLVAMVVLDPSLVEHLHAMRGTGDTHRVAPAVHLFACQRLQDILFASGFHQMGVALRVFASAFLAHDLRCFSHQQRLIDSQERTLLITRMFQPYALKGMSCFPQSIMGLPKKGLLACLYNGNAQTHMMLHLAVLECMPDLPRSMTPPTTQVTPASAPWLSMSW